MSHFLPSCINGAKPTRSRLFAEEIDELMNASVSFSTPTAASAAADAAKTLAAVAVLRGAASLSVHLLTK